MKRMLSILLIMMVLATGGSLATAEGAFHFDFTPESIEIDERFMTVGLEMDADATFGGVEVDDLIKNNNTRVEMVAGILMYVTYYSDAYGTAENKDDFYTVLWDKYTASLIDSSVKIYSYKTGKARATTYFFFEDCLYVVDIHPIAGAITVVRVEMKNALTKAESLTEQWASEYKQNIYPVNCSLVWARYRKLVAK